MWLLNFLLDNVGRVFSLVDWYYNRIIDAARNAFNWARSEANRVYWQAIAFVQSVVANARAYAWNLVQGAKKVAVDLWNSARGFASLLFHLASAALGLAITNVRNFLIAWIEGVKAELIKIINGVGAAFDAAFRAAILIAWAPFRWLIDLKQDILAVLAILDEHNRPKLVSFLRDDWPAIKAFLSNPVGYFLAILRAFLLDMLTWTMAYSLGAVAATLPPWPNFLKGVPGGGSPSPGPPPKDSGDLVAPLSSLRISGNKYGQGHPGLDLGCSLGQAVSAMHSGVIEESGFSAVGYGWTVTLRGGKWWSRYAHFQSQGLPRGTSVNAGEVVGLCGSSGNSTGSHLHLEIKSNGSYVNPAPILGLT